MNIRYGARFILQIIFIYIYSYSAYMRWSDHLPFSFVHSSMRCARAVKRREADQLICKHCEWVMYSESNYRSREPVASAIAPIQPRLSRWKLYNYLKQLVKSWNVSVECSSKCLIYAIKPQLPIGYVKYIKIAFSLSDVCKSPERFSQWRSGDLLSPYNKYVWWRRLKFAISYHQKTVTYSLFM